MRVASYASDVEVQTTTATEVFAEVLWEEPAKGETGASVEYERISTAPRKHWVEAILRNFSVEVLEVYSCRPENEKANGLSAIIRVASEDVDKLEASSRANPFLFRTVLRGDAPQKENGIVWIKKAASRSEALDASKKV